jgi:Cyclin, N-terminal domain
VSPRKRSIYIQWLINSVEQFEFDFETFLLAVNLFDRFMAITALKHDYDQKMAIAAAFLVAAKKVSKTLLLVVTFF